MLQLRSFLPIWKPHQWHNKLSTIYHEVMKTALGLRLNTPICIRYHLTGWLTLKDQIFVQYFKLLTKMKYLRMDHPLHQETDMDTVLTALRKPRLFPTLYHKQLAQRYHTYAVKIQEHYLNHNSMFTKTYLTGLIKQHHKDTLIPEQVQKARLKDPASHYTTEIFNQYSQDPYFDRTLNVLYHFSADTVRPILQLFTNWSFLNYSGYRYNILVTPNCPYCNVPETTEHFLLNCEVFEENRSILKHKLRKHKVNLTLKALFGLIPATRRQLIRIFLSLYDYITDTKRQKIGYSSDILYWNKILKKQKLHTH